jgi:Family of unknown function (DUF6325)
MTQTHPDRTHTDMDVGPIDYLVVEFPNAKFTGEALGELVDLVDRGIIRVLDMRVAMVTEDGFTAMALTDVDGDGELDLTVFAGVESGLLEDDDLAKSAALVGPGDAVALLVYENTWAGPFVSALRRKGADVVASGRIPATDVVAALEALETARPTSDEEGEQPWA